MRKFFDFIFSMQFAGTLLLVFAATVGTATFIENDYGTLAAKTVVYSAKWFEWLLVLTSISLIGSVFKYKLYERKKYSVLFFHLAFVVILIGAAITRYAGWEGSMMIREGASSNTVISDAPYLQVSVTKNGKIYQYDREHLFNEFKKNRFSEDFQMDGEKFSLDFKQYIPNAAEAVVEAANGIPIITYVTVDRGQRRTALLKAGECNTISGFTVCFNNSSADTTALHIFYNEAAGLQFRSPVPGSVMNMTAGTNEEFSADSLYTLNTMQLYNFNGIQIVVRSFFPSGKTQMVASSQEGNGVAAIVFDLAYQNNREEIAVFGGKGMLGQPVTTRLGDAEFQLAYGSKKIEIPFSIMLRDFQLERYPGSMSPSSFASEVTVIDPANNVEKPYRIFMNNILNYGGFRFFQSSYDKDELGTVLSVNHDFWGTAITYLGYFILAAGLVFNFFSKHSRFRKLAAASAQMRKNSTLASLAILVLSGMMTITATAQENTSFDPLSVDKAHAASFAELLVQDRDGRMKPVNTLSSEILRKIYRKDNIMGLNSDQAFLGMISNPSYWQGVPMIKVTDKELKRLIGVDGKYAAFNDFLDQGMGYYLLSEHVNTALNKKPVERTSFDKDVIKVDERVNIFFMAISGDFLNIFPEPGHPNNKWHNAKDPYSTFDSTDAGFVANILPVYSSAVIQGMQTGNWAEADANLGYLKVFQEKYGNTVMPSKSKTNLEIFYNKINIFKKFHRVHDRDAPSVKGTGLGLYWVHEIIRHHGGRTSVFSEGKNRGSTFRVELPVYRPFKNRRINRLLKIARQIPRQPDGEEGASRG